MANLFVENEDVKVAKSSFATYENESAVYEGRNVKFPFQNLVLLYKKENRFREPIVLEILKAIYKLKFATSRQITQFLILNLKTEISQNKVCRVLDMLTKFSCISRYSFTSDERISNTALKVYSLDSNGKLLLTGANFKCNWKITDTLNIDNLKEYCAGNQYLIKLCETGVVNYDDINNTPTTKGISAIYSIANSNHVLIIVRNKIGFEKNIVEIVSSFNTSSEIYALSRVKYIIQGENDSHNFNIFKTLQNIY